MKNVGLYLASVKFILSFASKENVSSEVWNVLHNEERIYNRVRKAINSRTYYLLGINDKSHVNKICHLFFVRDDKNMTLKEWSYSRLEKLKEKYPLTSLNDESNKINQADARDIAEADLSYHEYFLGTKDVSEILSSIKAELDSGWVNFNELKDKDFIRIDEENEIVYFLEDIYDGDYCVLSEDDFKVRNELESKLTARYSVQSFINKLEER